MKLPLGIRAIVFDFDGTLVDSNRLKYDAYFDLFTADTRHDRIIREVLSERFEQTRYVILEDILRRLGKGGHAGVRREVNELAERYNDIVVAGVKSCPERPGAGEALKKLAQTYALYLSSTTPENSLKEILQFRKWDGYFRSVFGYPHEKGKTVRRIMALEKLKCDQVLVVGDGETDRNSATENGCPFLPVTEGFSFEQMERMLVTYEDKATLIRGRKGTN